MDNELSVIIGNRINTLLAEQGKKQKELSEYLGGIPENTISYFCSGKRIPNTSQIKKIADYFNVSADYLLGLTNTATTDKDVRFICEYTGLKEEAVIALNTAVRYLEQYKPEEDTETFGIINSVISSGLLTSFSSYTSEYKEELKKAAAKYNEMADFFSKNQSDDNTRTEYDDFTPSDIDKELYYRLFVVQEKVKDFMQTYTEKERESLTDAIARYMISDKVSQLSRNGEPHGDNTETE